LFARTSQNTFGAGVTGGTVPTGNIIFDLSTWKPFVEPTNTPILKAIKKGKSYDQRVFNWGQSQFTANKSLVSGTLTNNATTINVTAGDGVLFQVNSMVAIYDQVGGSSPARYDYTTKELVWVTAISTDALTVVRGMGGTTGICAHHNRAA